MNHRHRILIDIDSDQHKFLKTLPYGWRKLIFGNILNIIMKDVELYGTDILSKITAKNVTLNYPKQLL